MSKADKLRIPDYLGHILEAVHRAFMYVEGMTETQFLNDAKTQDAVIRNFEIIGEACHKIELQHPDYASEHQKSLGDSRTRCAMHCSWIFVDFEIVWRTLHMIYQV
jgi:uncharacterized protein with HEPN domain